MLLRIGSLAVVLVVMAGPGGTTPSHGEIPDCERTEDVVYGRKHGTALTYDVFRPTKNAKGIGVIFVVSGGWFSAKEAIAEGFVKPMVARGYTVFAVTHGSQPKYSIPEILEDMHRSVRHIRSHAKEYGIDPGRIGIYGGSAGGHLSLMQGTAGKEGNPLGKDAVEKESSRVQAVACFFPPTDFLNYGKEGEEALGTGVLKDFPAPFEFRKLEEKPFHFEPITDPEERRKIGKEIAPINHLSPDDPPMLILHGDADALVPIQQAEIFVERAKKEGATAVLEVKKGGLHGWPNMEKDIDRFADWFDEQFYGTAAPVKP